MTNLRLLAQNKADVATITASVGTTLSANLPITNLQKYNNSRVARFTSISDSGIKGNFSSKNVINCVALWRQTFTPTATWRVRFYDAVDQGGTLIYDSGGVNAIQGKSLDELDWGIDPLNMGALAGTGQPVTVLWTADYEVRSFLINVYDPAANLYFDIARLYIGRYFEPQYNGDWGLKHSNVDNTTQFRTHGAGMWSSTVAKYRKISFGLSNLTPKDRTTIMEAFDYAGKTKDIFISIFPENGGILEHDYSFAGKFVNSPEISTDFYNNYASQYEIEEV